MEHGPALRDGGWWEAEQRLRTVIGWRQAAPPYVVVLADRRGADLHAFLHGPDERTDVEREVSTDGEPLRRSLPAAGRSAVFQERTENDGEQHAERRRGGRAAHV